MYETYVAVVAFFITNFPVVAAFILALFLLNRVRVNMRANRKKRQIEKLRAERTNRHWTMLEKI